MRIAMAMLADAVNIREGMISVLSAGISNITRPEYPAPLGIELALAIELSAEDLGSAGEAGLRVDVVGPDGSQIASVEGEFRWDPSEFRNAYISAPINLRDGAIPSPGAYNIRLEVGDLDVIEIPLNATLLSA